MIEKLLKLASTNNPQFTYINNALDEIDDSPFAEDAKQEQREILQEAEDSLPKLAYQLKMSLSELDNLLSFELQKTAQASDSIFARNSFGGHAARGGAAILGNALGGMATSVINDLYHSAKGAITEKKHFNDMLKENPDLTELNPDRVKSLFKSFHRMGGPELSGDPNVAGAFVRFNAMHDKGIDLTNVRDMVGTRHNLEKSKDTIRASQGIPGLDILNTMKELEKNTINKDNERYKRTQGPSHEQAADRYKFEQEERDRTRRDWKNDESRPSRFKRNSDPYLNG